MRRDSTRVIYDILVLAERGASKTQIVYRGNLNFRFAGPYIDFLLERDLVRLESKAAGRVPSYHLTERGVRFLRLLSQVEAELVGFSP
ncbi:hypothetical protein AUH73_07380 [archaeon 13_1_40CM_4_53_4]|nr:MAG: hypothetical protein AUI07_09765 [archaeon 13_2_20CM_2_53_6]OLC61337.1 MAG: hypothetical protein AUH73_07380 [archaeon 13_1_40CM_4_53_4]